MDSSQEEVNEYNVMAYRQHFNLALCEKLNCRKLIPASWLSSPGWARGQPRSGISLVPRVTSPAQSLSNRLVSSCIAAPAGNPTFLKASLQVLIPLVLQGGEQARLVMGLARQHRQHSSRPRQLPRQLLMAASRHL